MKVIGITGGVGAGKTEILAYLKENYKCRVVVADRVAHDLEKPGEACYERIVELLGEEVTAPDGTIDKHRMAERIFADKELLAKVNEIVHPAVKETIIGIIRQEKEAGVQDYLFIEAALLIEGGYGRIVDEMWYIHTEEEVRRRRLKLSRGYSEEKIDQIISGQLSEEEYDRHCQVVIENSGTLESVYQQIDEKLGENLCQK